MKPRIFIAIHYLEIGGAEASLIGLLEALDPEKVDVDLFIYSHQGELMSTIPRWINLLPEEKQYACIETPMKDVLKKGQIIMLLSRLWAKVKYSRYHKTLSDADRVRDIMAFPMISKAVMPFLPSLYKYGKYDLAISYLQPHDIVRNKVKAKKYLAWIHTDYSTVHVDVDREIKSWERYDYINSISPDCKKAFLQLFPSLVDKIVEIENILPQNLVKKRAGEFEVDWDKETEIATNSNLVGGGKKL